MLLGRKNPLITTIEQLADNGMESLGKYYSMHRAFVFDNADPLSVNRLLLIVPDIAGMEPYTLWAHPRNNYFGKDYGMQIIPNKGDMVWVEFEGGNPEIPVWSHGHPGTEERNNDPELKDIKTYWFKSPNGNMVVINDTKNTIHVQTSLGDAVEINDKGISIITQKEISLGTINKSDQPAVLGNDVEDVLKDMQDFMQTFTTALGADIIASGGGFLLPGNLAKKTKKLLKLAVGLKNKIPKILSKKVSLD